MGEKEVPGFLSSLCWHKETPPGWGDGSHHEALGQELTSSSIPMSSSPTRLPGSLRRMKHPERSPIPAEQPWGRYLFGHSLGWALLLGSPWGHISNRATQVFPEFFKSLVLLHVLYTILETNTHHLLKTEQKTSLPTDVVLWKLKYLQKQRHKTRKI